MSAMRTPTERQELHWCTKQKSGAEAHGNWTGKAHGRLSSRPDEAEGRVRELGHRPPERSQPRGPTGGTIGGMPFR